jgi:AI-2 transport protein TqsA
MTGDGTIRGMLALCTAILVAAALYLGRSIFAPVAFSLFALAIVWPFQGALQAKIPKLVALVFTLLLTLIVFAMLGLAIAWGSGQVGHWLLSNVDRFQFVYTKTTEWLEGHGIFVTGMVADRFDVACSFRSASCGETQLYDWFCPSCLRIHDFGAYGSKSLRQENQKT